MIGNRFKPLYLLVALSAGVLSSHADADEAQATLDTILSAKESKPDILSPQPINLPDSSLPLITIPSSPTQSSPRKESDTEPKTPTVKAPQARRTMATEWTVMQQTLTQLRQQLADVVAALNQTTQQASQQHQEAAQQLSELHRMLEESQQTQLSLKQQLAASQVAANSFRQNVCEPTKEVTELRQRMFDDELILKAERLAADLQSVHLMGQTTQQPSTDAGHKQLVDLTQQLSEARQTLAEKEQQLAALQKQQSHSDDVQNQLADLTQQLKEARQALAGKEQQLAAQQKQQSGNDDVQNQLADLTQQLNEAKQALDVQNAHANDLQQRLTASEQSAASADEKSQSVAKLLAEKEEQLSALQNQKQSDVEQKLANMTQQLNDEKKALEEQKEHASALQQRLTDSTLLAASMDEKSQSVAKQLAEKVQQLNEQQQAQTEAKKQLAELTQQLDEAKKSLDAEKATTSTLKQQLMQSEHKAADANIQGVNKLPAEPQKTPVASPVVSLNTPDEIRDYALGVYWANEMQDIMKEKAASGYHIARQQVLYGAADMMNNQLKMPIEKLAAVLRKLDKESGSTSSGKQNDGQQFMTSYARQSGVKHSPEGFWYKTTKNGAGKIAASDTVAVVMRESLWNGKVINDMSAKNKVLVLPLNQFPPLFKAAISLMGNHGAEEIVVPPELAYGPKGRPPEIPPNSVMVYQLKVLDVNPQTPKATS